MGSWSTFARIIKGGADRKKNSWGWMFGGGGHENSLYVYLYIYVRLLKQIRCNLLCSEFINIYSHIVALFSIRWWLNWIYIYMYVVFCFQSVVSKVPYKSFYASSSTNGSALDISDKDDSFKPKFFVSDECDSSIMHRKSNGTGNTKL